MNWSNVFVIFRREVNDQVRDRRTLFMIFVLPILLYPIMGIGVVQFSAAFEQKPRTVLVVGPENLPAEPPLFNAHRDGFDRALFDAPNEATRLHVLLEPAKGRWLERAPKEAAVRGGLADAVVSIPSGLREQLERVQSAETPIIYDSTDERSQITYLRVKEVLSRWKESVLADRLKRDKKPPGYTEPIQVKPVDVATLEELGGSVWGRLLPFILVMMALTGAFYPAIDLCAGEKERGTMETLLISPASRSEIVMGKFLTVVLASMMTALLNLVSMGLTGLQLAQQVGGLTADGPHRIAAAFRPPTMSAAFWMFLLLIPLSAFFSAVSLSLAVLARSMKEGQYYLTPLYLVSMPLVFLTLAPGIELNLFFSLVPITGVSLLLRALILGDYAIAWKYFLPVLVPTTVYGSIALKWAIEQFQREDVLFREAERFDLRIWVRHLFRDKEPTPTGAEALLCFAVMLSLAWFLSQYLASSGSSSATTSMAIGQIVFILVPPLAMGLCLTSSPRRTLRLYWPKPRYLLLAVGLVLALNPLVNELRPIVERLFPVSESVKTALESMMKEVPSLETALLIFAVIPALCEEFAFRGFILTGLERGHRTGTAILLSALLFGFLHVLLSLFQQLFNATLLGIILGLLAIRSRSILPGILFHFLNNGIAVVGSQWGGRVAGSRAISWIYRNPAQGLYHWAVVAIAAVIAAVLLVILYRDTGSLRPTEPEPGIKPLEPATSAS
jgi:sodium transport system permease protein